MEKPGVKHRQSVLRPVFSALRCVVWIIVDPGTDPNSLGPHTSELHNTMQAVYTQYSFITKSPLQPGSSPLALILILALATKWLNQRLVFAFLSCTFYFLFLLTILLFVQEFLLCVFKSPSLHTESKCMSSVALSQPGTVVATSHWQAQLTTFRSREEGVPCLLQ